MHFPWKRARRRLAAAVGVLFALAAIVAGPAASQRAALAGDRPPAPTVKPAPEPGTTLPSTWSPEIAATASDRTAEKAGSAPASIASQTADLLSAAAQGSAHTCSARIDAWSTSSQTFQTINTCTLTLPTTGTVYLSAGASAGLWPYNGGQPFEAQFRIAVDGENLARTDRRVNVYTDSGDGTDENVATQAVVTLGPGDHTVSFVGALSSGAGPVQLYRPSITAIYAPLDSDIQMCGSPELASWQPPGAGQFQPISSCTLTLPITGTVYLSASASVGLAPGGQPFEAAFGVYVDDAFKNFAYMNVYTDSGNGTDKIATVQIPVTLGPGAHTFYLKGGLQSGAGPVQLTQPSIAAVYIPQNSTTASACGGINGFWSTSNTTSYQPIIWCTLTVTNTSTVYMSAGGWARPAQGGQPFEAQFQIGIDGYYPIFSAADRWINVYADGGDGTDKTVATQWRTILNPGTHTILLAGKLSAGSGPATLSNATITAVTLGGALPTISDIPDQLVVPGQKVGPLPVTIDSLAVGIGELQFGAHSYNQDLVPNNFEYGGSGRNRTLSFTVNPSKTGVATITYGVYDGTNNVDRTFRVRILGPAMIPLVAR